jgi:hypothetical protein
MAGMRFSPTTRSLPGGRTNRPSSKLGDSLEQACCVFYVVQTISAKFCMHAGNMKFNAQKEET